MRLLFQLNIILLLILSSGCCSYMVMEKSKKEIHNRRTVTKDNVAIRAVQLGEDTVGVGLDISNLEALKEHPWLQFLAAGVDTALLYAAKELGQDVFNKDKEKDININITVNTTTGETITTTTTVKQ